MTLAADAPDEDVLALDEALTALAERHADKAQLVKLRYFGGLTLEEAAEALGISTLTADRHWAYARAWLYRRINDAPPAAPGADGAPRRATGDPSAKTF